MTKAVAFWGRTLLASALLIPASPGISLAAEGADAGWFDPQSPGAPRGPSAPPPAAPVAATGSPEAVPGAPLPSSPLLDRGGAVAPAPSPPSSAADRDPRALSDFRPALDPYGSWMNHPTYGTIWIPNPRVVGSDFSPYVSAGRWALDDAGNWVWMSDYPFGGVVFHYGRWVWVGGTGWAWVPGYEYAPAWVTWRVPTSSYAYVGWAPMGPDFIWYGGFAVSFWYGVYTPWIYCPSAYVFHDHVHHHVVRNPATVTHLNQHTRSYVPANPSAHVARHSGPPLGEARVPQSAAPRDRVPSTRPVGGRGPASATFAQRARFTSDGLPSRRNSSAPAEATRFRLPSSAPAGGETSRFDSRPAPSPSKSLTPSSTTSRVPSTPRSFKPDTGSSSRSFAPKSFSPPSSSRSFSPSPSTRSFSPSLPSGGGGLPRGRR